MNRTLRSTEPSPTAPYRPGETLWFYSKGMRHCYGSAVVQSVHEDEKTLYFRDSLPDGVGAGCLILDQEVETVGDMMREILREFNQFSHLHIRHRGPYYLIGGPYSPYSGFLMRPFGWSKGYGDSFLVTPIFENGERTWIFNVRA